MRVVGAVLAAALLLLTGCTDDGPRGITLDNRPVAESDVDVDTPALREAKAAAGIADCTPGPGGGQLPGLTLPCLGGGTAVDLSSLKGPMVLSFWGSWCGPCAEEMPALQDFYEQYGDQVPVLGVDFTDRYPASAIEQMARARRDLPVTRRPGWRRAGVRRVRQDHRHADAGAGRRRRRRSPTASSSASTAPTRSSTWSASTSGSQL